MLEVNDEEVGDKEEEDSLKNGSTEKNDDDESKTKEINCLKKEVKKLTENMKAIVFDFTKCESELKIKTEEVGKLKIEIKDLKQILELEEETDRGNSKAEKTSSAGKAQPKTVRQPEPQYNCMDCYFQGTSKQELTTHINIKHKTERVDLLKCRNCGESFTSKPNLMDHRKDKHASTVAPCRNNIRGACQFSSNMCWWSHAEQTPSNDLPIKCYICNETFERKSIMMI